MITNHLKLIIVIYYLFVGRSQIKLYQITSHISKSKGFNKELMVRPRFPTIYRESEKLDVSAISEVIVIVDDAWKVGDFVDWFTDGCYWCGKVTEISGNDKVQVIFVVFVVYIISIPELGILMS